MITKRDTKTKKKELKSIHVTPSFNIAFDYRGDEMGRISKSDLLWYFDVSISKQ